MFEVSVQQFFSAAHMLRNYKGKCENIHGHNWKVQVFVSKEGLNKQGMVVDFTDLKKILCKILSSFDHKFLNDIPYFKKNNPTSENIAKYIYDELLKRLDIAQTAYLRVCVWETENSCATYYTSKASF